MNLAALLGAAFFTFAGIAGACVGNTVAEQLPRFDDGPPPGTPPVPWLVGACALIGALAAMHTAAPTQLPLIAVVCASLVAGWCCDVRTGIIPDVFTIAPLALVLAVATWQHAWWIWVSAAVPLAPLAVAASLSGGRGMGWGDVKLAALGGAVLGAQLSLVAFAAASLVAFGVSRYRRRGNAAIAFAPYLAAAIGVAIPVGMLR